MITENLSNLFRTLTGSKPDRIEPIKQSGSGRKYYRLSDKSTSVIGCLNNIVAENEAFFHLSEVFLANNLNVPAVLQKDISGKIYLQTDFGDDILFNRLMQREKRELPVELKNLYKKVLTELVCFQTIDQSFLNSSKFYPVKVFNSQSIEWDLNYFKYYFLKLHDISFDENKLQNDFNTLKDFVLNCRMNFFMYRDFQSRNIIIKEDIPYFIDFQGGRKGPLAYDVVSLLYQAKVRLTNADREELLQYYLDELGNKVQVSEKTFLNYYYPIALIRAMQVLGAYGFRGIFQRKSHFLTSIGYGLENLESIMDKLVALNHLPELKHCLHELIQKKNNYLPQKTDKLTISIKSFSFLTGSVPADISGHGGGYTFDCRMLPNPGRYSEYKSYTGIDEKVKQFFIEHKEVTDYIKNAVAFTEKHIQKYIERKFEYLAINFGCTGGQHRSVYCAEETAKLLKQKFDGITVKVHHVMQNKSYTC